jgi:hypothetical protein
MSKWAEYKAKNGVTPLDLLNPKTKHSSNDVAERRMAICRACPHLFQPTSTCKKCGCFMIAKTKIDGAKCPLEKW